MGNGLLALALLPAILIIIYIYRKDKVEKEPWRLIIKLMIFGALSCIPASFMESFIDGVMPAYPEGSLPYALSMAFVSAALCEEICKFAFLRFGAWNNPEFGYRFDGIVYGVAVAVGFAALENVLYVAQGGFEVAISRGILAVPLHAFCGVYMGIFFGAAKQAQIRGGSSIRFSILALIVPMMIHGIYDTMAFLGSDYSTIALLAFVLLMYIVSIYYVRKFSKDDWKSGFYPETGPLSDMGREAAGGYRSGSGGGYGYGAGGYSGGGAGGYSDGGAGGYSDGGAGGYSSGAGGYSTGGAGGYRYSSGGPAGQSARGFGQQSGGYRTAGQGYRAHPGEVQDGKLILLCPHCRRGLRVPVGMGQIRVRCPHCGQIFEERT